MIEEICYVLEDEYGVFLVYDVTKEDRLSTFDGRVVMEGSKRYLKKTSTEVEPNKGTHLLQEISKIEGKPFSIGKWHRVI